MDDLEIYVNATCHGQFLDEIGIDIQISYAEDDDAWIEHALEYGVNPELELRES
ncbi:hypothetical protein NVP2275O_273 [Vibrio phage 2.275.O._10N.286.54.E11]|nr:hypothetical protein NVP2275O_273 [Vibrio phage 2.275.O._10N.286.54.E11]